MNSPLSGSNFSAFPLTFLAAAISSGILVSKFFDAPIYLSASLCFFLIALTFFFLFKNKFLASTICLLSAFFAVGNLLAEIEKKSVAENRLARIYDEKRIESGEPVTLKGWLIYEPEQSVGGYFLTLHVEEMRYKETEQKVSGDVRLFLPVIEEENKAVFENLQLRYGAKIGVAVRLRRDEKFRNAGVVSYKEILAQKNLDATGTVKSPLLIERFEDKSVFLPLALLYDWRQTLISELRHNFSIETSGVLIASLLNNRFFLTQETAERFREGGTMHVLVISGMHITFIGIWVIWLMRKLTRNRFVQFIVSVVFLWAYSLAVGAEVPVTRAALMFTVFYAASLFHREGNSINTLGAAAIALLVWRPSDLFNQSFQLTFVSVTAIVAFAFPLLEKMQAVGEWKPSADTPKPPICGKTLKTLCEILFWNERNWRISQKRATWEAKLFKSDWAKKISDSGMQPVLRYVSVAIFVSFVVTTFLVPFSVLFFHRLSLVSLVLNIFVGALMAIESLTAILAILLAQIHPFLAQPFIGFTELFNFLMVRAVEPFNYFGWTSIRPANYDQSGQIVYWIYFIPLIFLTVAVNRWNPFTNPKSEIQNPKPSDFGFFLPYYAHLCVGASACLLVVLFFFIVKHPNSEPYIDGRLTVDFIDVGQGDSALVTFPNGQTMLIDGGGRANFQTLLIRNATGEIEPFAPDVQSIGEAVVSKFLWNRGLRQVDYLMATHADTDHIDGLNDVARNFQVEKAFVGRIAPKDEEFIKFSESLTKRKIPLELLKKGDSFEIGGAQIKVLFPNPETPGERITANNNCIVLKISFGSRSFLFTADIEKETENLLVTSGENLQSDVVKIAHHGSKTSSIAGFIEAAKPMLAIASVGLDSPFGHPHKEVAERWKNAGAKFMTTGENGTITVSTDGTDLQIKTFVENSF